MARVVSIRPAGSSMVARGPVIAIDRRVVVPPSAARAVPARPGAPALGHRTRHGLPPRPPRTTPGGTTG